MRWSNGEAIPVVEQVDYLGIPLSKEQFDSKGWFDKKVEGFSHAFSLLSRSRLCRATAAMIQTTIMVPRAAYSAMLHRPTAHQLRRWRASFREAYNGNRLGTYLARIVFTEGIELLDPIYALTWRSLLQWHRIWKGHPQVVAHALSKWNGIKIVRGRIGPIVQLKKDLEFLSVTLDPLSGEVSPAGGNTLWKFGRTPVSALKKTLRALLVQKGLLELSSTKSDKWNGVQDASVDHTVALLRQVSPSSNLAKTLRRILSNGLNTPYMRFQKTFASNPS